MGPGFGLSLDRALKTAGVGTSRIDETYFLGNIMRRYVFLKKGGGSKIRKETLNALNRIFTLLDEAYTSLFKDI